MQDTVIRIKTDLEGDALENRLNNLRRFLGMKGVHVYEKEERRVIEFEFGPEGLPAIKLRATLEKELPGCFLVKLKSLSQTDLLSYCQRYYKRKPEYVFRPHLESILKKGAKSHGSHALEEQAILGTA